jgi:quercetin dioxygenase-like cupin family protein
MTFEVNAKHETATGELSEWALLYSLGMLDQDIASGFRQHLDSGCAVCERELRGFNAATAQTVYAIPAAAPAPRVREELMARTKKSRSRAAIVRAQEGEWQALPYPGVSAKLLFFDRETGFMTSLVRMAPGAVYPSHNHVSPEHSYVLEGDVRFEDHTLQAGDYEVALPSSAHTSITTAKGCLLLIINSVDNLRAMGV